MTSEDRNWILRHYRNGSSIQIIFQLYPNIPKREILELVKTNSGKTSIKYMEGRVLMMIRESLGLNRTQMVCAINNRRWNELRLKQCELDDTNVPEKTKNELYNLYKEVAAGRGIDLQSIINKDIKQYTGHGQEDTYNKEMLEARKRIRDLRTNAGLSQREFAEIVGVSEKGISRYESSNDIPLDKLNARYQMLYSILQDRKMV